MAVFWQETFLAKIRVEWLSRLVKFQYKVGSTWYDGVITSKTVDGDTLKITTVTNDSSTVTITGVRILDDEGAVAGELSDTIEKTSTQGVFTLREFPLTEI